MSVKLGPTDIATAYLGDIPVQRIYLGDIQVWPGLGAFNVFFFGDGDLTFLNKQIQPLVAILSGNGILFAPGRQSYARAVGLSGSGALSATVIGAAGQMAALSGDGFLTATTLKIAPLLAALNGTGSLTATDSQIYSLLAGPNGSGTLSTTVPWAKYLIGAGFTDDLNRADSTTSAGPGWTNRFGVVGIKSNGAYGVPLSQWSQASYDTPMTSDDMEVSVTMGVNTGSPNSAVLLGANTAGQCVSGLSQATATFITTQTAWGWVGNVSRGTVPVTFATGDVLTLRRVGNVYTVFKNGNDIGLTWTDSTNIVPRDSNHRLVGLATHNNGGAAPGTYRLIDAFQAVDANRWSGNGSLTATLTGSYAKAMSLSGDGSLTATDSQVYSLLPAPSGQGSLTATDSQIYSLPPSLSGTGTLSATAVAYAAGESIANFSGSGALTATTAMYSITRPAPLTGVGNLSAAAFRSHPLAANLSGSGALTAALMSSYAMAMGLSGDGSLTVIDSQIYSLSADFNGDGSLDFEIEGVVNVEEIDTFLDGDGELTAEAYGLINEMFAILSTTGTLSATVLNAYQRALALSGNGTLSATAKIVYQRLLDLLSTGSLTAQTYIKLTSSVGLSGAGALVALMWELGQSASDTGGTGTVSATAMPKYLMAASFSGGGILDPDAYDASYPDGLSARVYGYIVWWASLFGDGALSALARMYRLQITAALSGSGVLSATATKVQLDNRSAALSGTGTLSATVSQRYDIPVQVTNICPDPGFEDGTNWFNYNAPGVQSTEQAHSGSKSRKVTGTANWVQLFLTLNAATAFSPHSVPWQPTAPGRKIHAEAWLRGHPSNIASPALVYVRVFFADDTGAQVPDGNIYNPFDVSNIPANGWKQFAIDAIAPAGAVMFYADVLFEPGVPVSDSYYVDDAVVLGGDITPLTGSGTLSATVSQRYTLGYFDDFNRVDSTVSPGNGWVNRVAAGLGISGNALYPTVAGATWCIATAPVAMNSNDMEVSVIFGGHSGGYDATMIFLGCNEAGEGAFLHTTGTAFYIFTQTAWYNWTNQHGVGVGQMYAGDRITVQRYGNTYVGYLNGIQAMTWPDTGNIVPRDANHRLVGAGLYNDNAGYRSFDSFSTRDIEWLSGNGTLTASVEGRIPVPRSAALSGDGTLSATMARYFPSGPFNETNTARTNQAVPAGTFGAWVTLAAGGGGGGSGSGGSFSARAGGGGGGGGARIARSFVPRSAMGSTYSVVRGLGGAAGAAGGVSSFVSSPASVSCAGGGQGGNASGGTQGTAGGAGVCTVSGATVTQINGGAGAIGGPTNANAAAGANQTTASPGGGGGGGRDAIGTSRAGGKGGNSNNATGGNGASAGGSQGSPGGAAAAPNPGGGGGGGAGSNGNTVTGGAGGVYGAGGGGGGGGNTVFTGGIGGDGYTLIEWT